MRASKVPTVALLALPLLLGGCLDILGLPTGCNLVGCSSGLTVVFDTPISGAFRAELLIPGESAPRVVECPEPAACGNAVTFTNATPTTATLVITTAAGELRRPLRPEYTIVQPNGRNCEPRCLQGRVTVQVTGARQLPPASGGPIFQG